MGIVPYIKGKSSDVNSVEYEAYDEDYVDSDAAKENVTPSQSGIFTKFGRSGVIDPLTHDQVQQFQLLHKL